MDEQLSSRLTAAIDPGVVSLLVGFATEVCALAGERQVVLALDSGERFRDEDARILADSAEGLPSSLRLRVALSTHDLAQRKKADYLVSESDEIVALEVDPLKADAVSEWLADEGIDSKAAEDVVRLSGGYALHVGDLVDHLSRGGEIEEAPLNEQFAKRTREAWRALDPGAAAKVRAISVFSDPLPTDRLERFLSLSSNERGEFEDRLVDARIFSVEVNGQRWFHGQRRLFIVDEILGEDERASASAGAARELLEMYGDGIDPPRFSELARLVASAPELTQSNPGLASITVLDHDELAITAALMELIDQKAKYPVVGGDDLLTYAMTVFGAEGDLVAAVQRLQERRLLVVVEKEGKTAIVPYGWDEWMGATMSGRAEAELGRRPIPAVGSAVFALEIQPRLGVFRKALYAFGRPSFESLSEEASHLAEPAGGLIVVGKSIDPALLLRVSHAGRPMNVVATFGSEEAQAQAHSELATLKTETLNEELEVTDALCFPSPLVPPQRFVSALARIVPGNLGPTPKLKLPEALTPAVEMERRVMTLKVVRGLCSGVEAQGMQIESATGLAWYTLDGPIIEVEIRGGRENAEELEAAPELAWDHPFALFQLARQLRLAPGEWIGRQRFRSAKQPIRDDPVVDTVAFLADRASAFNRAQGGSKIIQLEEANLARELEIALEWQLSDAQALATLPIGAKLRQPVAWNLYLVVSKETQPAPDRFDSVVAWGGVPSSDGRQKVEVAVVETGDVGRGLAALEDVFDLSVKEFDGAGWGVPEHVLAPLLGYGVEEISVR